MASEEDVQRLEARIVELEDQLKAVRGTREPVEISAEEMQAFRKVSDAVASDLACGGACLSECRGCIILRCVSPCLRCSRPCIVDPCIVECSCGPCLIGGFGGGGGGRFGGLGQ